jgi:hypothetical protein
MVSTCNAPDLSKPMANIYNCREDDADNTNLAGQYRVLLPHPYRRIERNLLAISPVIARWNPPATWR